MEGLFRLLLVAGLLAMVLPAAAATFGPQPGAPCEPTLLATQVALFCAPDMPTAQCCEPVVAAVDLGGGVPCLCRVAAEPQLAMVGLNATHLLTLYTSCGGLRPGGAHLAAACQGPAPSASVVSAPPPSPGPRRKQPAHDAPPPPPSTEMPSPPPQQHDGAGLNASCGGLRPGGAHLAAAFEGSAPPPADVLSAPPPSHGPHRKLRAHEAPPPPPSTEKPSQPPQQHDGVAHSKAVPTYAATSPHAPPAAYEVLDTLGSPPPTPSPGTLSAPPPAGRLLATTSVPSSSSPSVATSTSSSYRWILVAILVAVIFIVVILAAATGAFVLYKKGNFGWRRMRHVEDDGRPPMVLIINNGLPLPAAPSESTVSAVREINSAAKEIVEQAEMLRRHSPRLAGETPLPGL